MNRQNITVQKLIDAGYHDFDFSDYTLDKAVERIKNGAKCELIPSFGYTMVGVIDGKEMFWREMTDEECSRYCNDVREMNKHCDEFINKVSRRNRRRR